MQRVIRRNARVRVRRANGEYRVGYAVAGPLEHLRHIGDFYLVAAVPYREAAQKKGAPPDYHAIGMYAPEQMQLLGGRRPKE